MENNYNIPSPLSRFAAFLIDSGIFLVLQIIIFFVIIKLASLPDYGFLRGFVILIFAFIIGVVFSFLGPFIYLTFSLYIWNKTIGMKILGLQAVKVDNSKLTFFNSLVRNFLYLIPFVMLTISIIANIANLRYEKLIYSIIFYLILFCLWYLWFLFNSKKQNLYDTAQNIQIVATSDKKFLSIFIVSFYLLVLITGSYTAYDYLWKNYFSDPRFKNTYIKNNLEIPKNDEVNNQNQKFNYQKLTN